MNRRLRLYKRNESTVLAIVRTFRKWFERLLIYQIGSHSCESISMRVYIHIYIFTPPPSKFKFFFHPERCEILHIPLTMTKLHMRVATLADIPRLAEIWAIAFLDDPFYNTIFPRRSEFMADYRVMWARKLQKRFLGPGEWYIVVEVDVVDAGGQSRREIVGWASWKRMGSSKAAEKIAADNESFLKGV